MIGEARAYIGHLDARVGMADLETESVDLIVTDPPYGVEFQSGRRADTFDPIENDTVDGLDIVREVVGECVRVVGQNRHLYVFGPGSILDGQKVAEVGELIWDKGRVGMGDLSAPWGPQHEPISFTVSKFRHGGKTGAGSLPVRLRKGSVLRFPARTGRTVRHPTEKPVALLRELIESSTRAGDIVVDPFAGVGSTGVAAILSGRRFIGFEIDADYHAIAAQRIAEAEAIFEKGVAL